MLTCEDYANSPMILKKAYVRLSELCTYNVNENKRVKATENKKTIFFWWPYNNCWCRYMWFWYFLRIMNTFMKMIKYCIKSTTINTFTIGDLFSNFFIHFLSHIFVSFWTFSSLMDIFSSIKYDFELWTMQNLNALELQSTSKFL